MPSPFPSMLAPNLAEVTLHETRQHSVNSHCVTRLALVKSIKGCESEFLESAFSSTENYVQISLSIRVILSSGSLFRGFFKMFLCTDQMIFSTYNLYGFISWPKLFVVGQANNPQNFSGVLVSSFCEEQLL